MAFRARVVGESVSDLPVQCALRAPSPLHLIVLIGRNKHLTIYCAFYRVCDWLKLKSYAELHFVVHSG